LLEIEQGASGGLVAFKVDNDDTDKVAVSIEAANIDADVMDISADAVTTANVIDITADALTTGSAAIFNTTSTALASTATGGFVEITSTGDTDTNVNNLLFIQNNHADSSGTIPLSIDQNSDAHSLYINSANPHPSNEVVVLIEHNDLSMVSGGNISDTTAAGGLHIDLTSDTDGGGSFIKLSSNSDGCQSAIAHIQVDDNDADLAFYTDNAGTLTEAMRIDNTGSVGIGTDSPGSELDLGGGYMANEQGRQDHVANTMPAPYYRFDGSNDYIRLASGVEDTLDEGNDWTVSLWFKLNDVDSWQTILGSMVTSANRLTVMISSNSYLATTFTHSGGGISLSSSDLDDLVVDKVYHLCLTWDESESTYAGYLNGVQFSGAVGAGWATSVAATDLGRATNNAYYTDCEIYGARFYNLLLGSTEVKELYSGASVPFKYKGASQTDLLSGWDFTSGWTGTGAASITDADTFTTSGSGGIYSTQSLTAGKQYSITIDMTISAGTLIFQAGTSGTVYKSGLTDGSTTFKFTQPIASGSGNLYIKTSGAATVDVTTFSLTQIGAVAEYDGSTAGAHQWGDKSGNALHGTVGDGAGGSTAPTLENTPYDSGTEYEEGTWDAVVTDGTTPMTMDGSYDTGYYTKVGNLVTVSGYFKTTSVNGLAAETIRITGLPFTIANNDAARTGGAAGYGAGLAITAGHTVTYFGEKNTTYIILFVWDATTGISNMTASQWTADGQIIIGFSYRAA
jgi:hypothetical protein